MPEFVWSAVGEDASEPLPDILIRKEAERVVGNGEFWWGLSTALGDVASVAMAAGGLLPVVFSARRPDTYAKDFSAQVWSGWESTGDGKSGALPKHVLITSTYDPRKEGSAHYALACRCSSQLLLHDYVFNPAQCRRVKVGTPPAYSQRAALLKGELAHARGSYTKGFAAELVAPWYVKLTDSRLLTSNELAVIRHFEPGDDWLGLVQWLRRS